jgi:hypothetical protein
LGPFFSARGPRGIFRGARQRSLAALGMTACFGLLLAASTALAANGIDITRGADAIVYGNCVPSLEVDNTSMEIIDYIQVDIAVALADGQERIVELKSAYREGVLHPIGAGGRITLKQQLDMSKALGVDCSQIKSRRVVRTICELEDGKSCASSMTVKP